MARKSLTGFDANGQRILAVASPSLGTDATNKDYVDNVANGRDWKEAVRVASTGNITVASPGATINGVAMAADDRVLLKDQSTGSQNGIYVWNGAATPMTRATDADQGDLTAGATVTAVEGTVDADKRYVLVTNEPITVGTTALVFTVDASGGTTYTAGSGLAEAPAGTFNVGAGTGITVSADSIAIDASVVARKFSASCAATTNPQTFNHALATSDVVVAVRELATGVQVLADVTVSDANNISVNFGGAPTAAQYRVTVVG